MQIDKAFWGDSLHEMATVDLGFEIAGVEFRVKSGRLHEQRLPLPEARRPNAMTALLAHAARRVLPDRKAESSSSSSALRGDHALHNAVLSYIETQFPGAGWSRDVVETTGKAGVKMLVKVSCAAPEQQLKGAANSRAT